MTEPTNPPLTSTSAEGPDEIAALAALDADQSVPWTPQHTGHAAWLARVLKQARTTRTRIADQFEAEITEITTRGRVATARFDRRIRWAETLLVEYAAKHGDDGHLDLPHATISARINPVSVQAVNTDDAVAWLTSHGLKDAVKIEASVKLADVKRAALSYGQLDSLDKSKLVAVGAAEGPVIVAAVDPETGEIEPQAVPGLVAMRRVSWTVTT